MQADRQYGTWAEVYAYAAGELFRRSVGVVHNGRLWASSYIAGAADPLVLRFIRVPVPTS